MALFLISFGSPILLLASEPVSTPATEKAVVGAGCFWCVEIAYEGLPGIQDVVSGYAGGPEANPTYKDVSRGATGHAEVVEITFDPEKISYERILERFFKMHDATDPRGVAPDFGPHYRSILLPVNEAQKLAAEKKIEELNASGTYGKKPIATQVVTLEKFYPAEDYHQDYVKKNPNDPYVRGVAIPKLKKLEKADKTPTLP